MTYMEQRLRVAGYVGRPATCFYNGKPRRGIIKDVKQGPCFPKNDGTFAFADRPYGRVYILWEEIGWPGVKSFKWELVSEFMLLPAEMAPAEKQQAVELQSETIVVVRRMRPTIGGSV
jgi:hypothetical protein